jgi:hypothetical protein
VQGRKKKEWKKIKISAYFTLSVKRFAGIPHAWACNVDAYSDAKSTSFDFTNPHVSPFSSLYHAFQLKMLTPSPKTTIQVVYSNIGGLQSSINVGH